jgi:hypothetical protein
LLVVRLCDVAPTGASSLVSRGFLNLTHRDGHEDPRPLEPGKAYTVTIRMDVSGYHMPAGHRWRLAISPTYWPMAWPSPEVVNLTLYTGTTSQLRLPLRTPRPADAGLPAFGPAESSQAIAHEVIEGAARNRLITRDVAHRRLEIRDVIDAGRIRLVDRNLEMYGSNDDVYTVVEGDPLSARIRCDRTTGLQRDGWHVRVETSSTLSADAERFHATNVLDAYEGDTRVFTKTWHIQIPRRLV